MDITLGEAVLYVSSCFLGLSLLCYIAKKCSDCHIKNTDSDLDLTSKNLERVPLCSVHSDTKSEPKTSHDKLTIS